MSDSTSPTHSETAADSDTRARLVMQTASFARAYLQWVESAGCDGLSYPRLRVLEELHCQGPAMMRALAEQLGLSARNMTALVDSLEEEGLVVRRAHPTDRRATMVELTAAGLQEATTAFEPRLESIGALFDELTPAQRQRMLDTVDRLLLALQRA